MTKTADEVWAAVKAEMEAMLAPFGESLDRLDPQALTMLRISAVTGWRLGQTEAADVLAEAASRG